MSATERPTEDAPASDVAGRLREAGFVRLVGAATGDALAASGVLARALAARGRPFQVSVADLAPDATRSTEADLTVAVGRGDPSADLALAGADRPASETAFAVARELDASDADGDSDVHGGDSDVPGGDSDAPGGDNDATGDDGRVALALAGLVADGRVADGPVVEAARNVGIERRPGVAVPTRDLADGLAHSTLVHAPFSAAADVAADLVASLALSTESDREAVDGGGDGDDDIVDPTALDDEDRRRVASLVALRTVGSDDVPPRAGEAVERLLRPFAGGPFGTVGGYGDVLDAVARERPGTGVALALGHDVAPAALDAWRAHARRAHAAVRDATTGRYDGLYVARAETPDAPVGTMARLTHAYRSPEPFTLAVTEGAAAAAADKGTDLAGPLAAAAEATDGHHEVRRATGLARFDADTAAFITAFREAV